MARLLISNHNLVSTPGVGGLDAYRFHVNVKHSEEEDEEFQLVVDVSRTAAAQTGLSRTELDARLEDALQSYAAPKLANDRPSGEQALSWNSPIVLRAEHFD